MSHLKRQKVPKNWPVQRKGTKFVVRPRFSFEEGLPLLVILRDVLKVAQNRKEVKKAIYSKNILLNNRELKDERTNALLFDTITLVPSKKSYKLGLLKNGRFDLEEIKKGEENQKIAKIVNKRTLKKKKTQLNLSDGRNFISDIKCNINDSVLINFKDKKIEKCLPLKEKEKVIIFAGKHSGATGKVNKIKKERKMAELDIEGKKINVLIKQLMVIEQ